MKFSKIIAVAFVLAFCASMFAITVDSNDSSADTKEYHVFAEVVDETGKVVKKDWFSFTSEANNNAFVTAANNAAKDKGFDKLVFSVTAYGVSVVYDTSSNSACYYVKDGKWVDVVDTSTDYVNNSVIALSLSHGYVSSTVYSALSESAQKEWKSTGYGGDWAYQKVVTESVDGYKPAGNNNNVITYVVIGAVAVIAIAIVAFILIKKRA